MTPGSPVTIFALAIPPIVAVIFVLLYWFKRDPLSQPSIVAALPLGLISIAILLGQSAFFLVHTFNEIATRQTAGMGAVKSGMLLAQRPLIWGFLDFVVCLVIILLVSAILRYSRDPEPPLVHAYVSLPSLIVTSLILTALFLMIYMQYGTVDLVMKIVDTHRNHELASQYGTVSPGYFAATVSSRLVALFFLSPIESFALLIAGVLDLFLRQKQNSRQSFAAVLILGALVGCGVSALSELGFVDYLRHVR